MTPLDEPKRIEPLVVPINEAATLLGVSRDTIYKMIEKGELRSVHAFKRHLVRTESLNEFINRGEKEAETQRELRLSSAPGYVYFAMAEGLRIKIGYSTDPERRIREMQTGASAPLRLIATIPGNPATEREFHKRFKEYRLHREWFKFAGKLRLFIQRLP